MKNKKVEQSTLFYAFLDFLRIERTLIGRTPDKRPELYASLVAASANMSALYIEYLLMNMESQ
jgi:hypothetical protein